MKIVTEAEYLLIKKAKKNAERLKKIRQLNRELTQLLKSFQDERSEN